MITGNNIIKKAFENKILEWNPKKGLLFNRENATELELIELDAVLNQNPFLPNRMNTGFFSKDYLVRYGGMESSGKTYKKPSFLQDLKDNFLIGLGFVGFIIGLVYTILTFVAFSLNLGNPIILISFIGTVCSWCFIYVLGRVMEK